MAKEPRPIPFLALGEEQKLALDLAGTVGLPSPFPAHGFVAVIRVPTLEPGQKNGDKPAFYVKIVHSMSPKQIATAFLHPEDVRAVRIHLKNRPVADQASWEYLNRNKVQAQIKAALDELAMASADPHSSIEVRLFEEAIVFVPESAPLLARLEFAVVAAVAAEMVPLRACPPEAAHHFACPH
jgi:hypothetical protein